METAESFNKAERLLCESLNSSARFRDGQWQSIEALLNKKRVLVVQRTGWGKSMVYFLATKLLRDDNAGITLIISPLLSLMRNQIESAKNIGVVAKTINSSNFNEWDSINLEIRNGQLDILLISPERLANDKFRTGILTEIAHNIGLFVVDEAHCISDWGHDFRPDYRRIVRILDAMPANLPVLATTATANNRVVEDIKTQLGENVVIQKGSLVRTSLMLQNITLSSQASRLAWLAENIPRFNSSGIVYALTVRDAELVESWLQKNGIVAKAYHGDIDTEKREELEQDLIDNKIKVLVATVALGMGFDKSDLGFVIHYQKPASVVHYYQQVGRAGRAIDEAFGILLHGSEDENITNYFIDNAFPPVEHIQKIIEKLLKSEQGLSINELQEEINLQKGQIKKVLKFLSLESPSPINKSSSKYQATATAYTYKVDVNHFEKITKIRKNEQQQMREYMQYKGCLMSFLQTALDDDSVSNCGKCYNCLGSLLDTNYDEELAKQAQIFLKRNFYHIKPKKQLPTKDFFTHYHFNKRNIPENLRANEGRALSLWKDEGWGNLVYRGKYIDGCFDDELVNACAEMINNWQPQPVPTWLTCIPSRNHPKLVMDFAKRLAHKLNMPFVNTLDKAVDNPQQKNMLNSYQQAKNLDGAFELSIESNSNGYEPCFLIDDMVDSGWTFTIASALLRSAGCSAVFPLALALNSTKSS